MGWFDTVCGWCEAAGHTTLNAVSLGGRWGDKFYGAMDGAASAHVTGLANDAYQQTLQTALSNGSSQLDAEILANKAMGMKMDALISPNSLSDIGDLLSSGMSIGKDTITKVCDFSSANLGLLVPVLIGAGVLGGVYLMADSLSPSTPRRA